MSFKISQAINTIVSHSSRSALNVFCNPILPKTIGNFNHKQAGKEKIRHRPSRNSGRTLRQPRLFRAVPHRGCPCAALLLNFSSARQARSIHKTDSPAVHFTGSLRRAAIFLRQHRTIHGWSLKRRLACRFSGNCHKNAREYTKYSLRFLFNLPKNRPARFDS